MNILQRLNAVQLEIDYIQKDKKAGMNYTIVSHDKVTAAVRPFLVKHGVVYWPHDFRVSQDGNRTQLVCSVRFASITDKDDYIDVHTMGYGIDAQDKGPGKAISYAVKYALLKALGLETGDDPDHDSIPHEPVSAKAEKPPQKYDRNPIVRATFDELMRGVRQCANIGTMEDLRAYWLANAAKINALPADWKVELENEKEEAKAALAVREAA